METKNEDFTFLREILKDISSVELKKTKQRMIHSAKIRDTMNLKGWNNNDLLKALNKKSPSIISKWLSGTHNFTQDTLVEIGDVLGIDFFETKKINVVVDYHYPSLVSEPSDITPLIKNNHYSQDGNIYSKSFTQNFLQESILA